ncbi:MAG TPA: YihY/virulence factor BrkB family protein [Gemmataceae bacterium]|nr:YihY/virulence factor BrkB family protein [Gemmataceae bacterium]
MKWKSIYLLFKDAGKQWLANKAPRLGAALAFYTIFSLAPLLVIIMALAGLLFGREAVQHHISDQVQSLVGGQGAEAINAMVASANKPRSGIVASVLGIIMLIFGAGGLFGQLQDALNTIWGVEPKPGRGIWGMLQERFLSFSMVLGSAFLLLVSLVVSTALAALGGAFGDWQHGVIGQIVNTVVDLIVITLLFAMIYKFLPDVKISWKDVWLGAFVTAVLFTIGKVLIGLYLGRSSISSSYGAAGSLAVLLIWLYYASQIFLFGAELTKAYGDHFGSRIVPADHAEPISARAQAEQGLQPARQR